MRHFPHRHLAGMLVVFSLAGCTSGVSKLGSPGDGGPAGTRQLPSGDGGEENPPGGVGPWDGGQPVSQTVDFQDGVSPTAGYHGTADTELVQNAPSAIYGGQTTFYVDADTPNDSGKIAPALLRFDLSSIPAGSKVTAATLTLSVTNQTSGSGFNVYAVSRAWGEYEANWNVTVANRPWASAGARGSTDHGSAVLLNVAPKMAGTYSSAFTAAGVSAVQNWVNKPSTNFGLFFDPGSNKDAAIFSSSEAQPASVRPKLSVTFTPPPARGTGLLGEYFSDVTLHTMAQTRVDPSVNFDFDQSGGADAGTPAGPFSVRWTGQVVPLYSESYRFDVTSNGGTRLYVNGTLLFDDWSNTSAHTSSGSVSLTAGKKVDVRLEYQQTTASGNISLGWQSAHQNAGDLPTELLYPAAPRGMGGTPIKYVLVIVKENHTFDNYFAGFPGAATSLTAPLANGTVLSRPVAPNATLPRDLCHTHTCAVQAYAGGKMNGLSNVSGSTGSGGKTDNLAFARFTESQIPNYWQYARNFVLADHFFSTTLSQSFPGHFATDMGFNRALKNPDSACGAAPTDTVEVYDRDTCAQSNSIPCWNSPSVVNELPKGFTWAEYGTTPLSRIKPVIQMAGVGSHFKSLTSVLTDVQAANPPNLMFAHISGGSGSEHPPQAVCPGENQSVQIINAVMKGPHWKETAILLLWDDWGGWYDSVTPSAPKCPNGDFTRPGFRIPLMIISPFAKKGFVLHNTAEQASISRLIEDLWGMPRLQPQDSNILDNTAGSLLDAFDFTQAARAPLVLTPRTCP